MPDVGIVELGHVNVAIADQLTATDFYVTALGLTRDPYLTTGTGNMWINVGKSQFHLPTGTPQRLRGRTGIVVPDVEAVRARLTRANIPVHDDGDAIDVTTPWGNAIRAHPPDPCFGPARLSIAYLEIDVPPGTAAGIGRFYRELIGATVHVHDGDRRAHVSAGDHQTLIFAETETPLAADDGHHIQVYIDDFAATRERLAARGLVTAENGPEQFRFNAIVDPDDGRELYTLEHETRSTAHHLYGRPLVNRDSTIDTRTYAGVDALAWGG